MYATTTTGHREHVSKSADTRVLQAMSINSNYCRLIQMTTTTTETWVGLSYTDANALCVASETSTLNGYTRSYLGGAKISVSGTGVTTWATIEGCWGTKVVTQIQRMGDTNLYQVSRTTTEYTVTNNGGSMTLI